MLGAFLAGERVGPLSFVREIVNSIEQKEIQRLPSPTPGPSVPAAKIEIRSPISGAHVSGETTFAASVNERPLSDYKMFWLVDNDHLNPMVDSNESEPHKQLRSMLLGGIGKRTASLCNNVRSQRLERQSYCGAVG